MAVDVGETKKGKGGIMREKRMKDRMIDMERDKLINNNCRLFLFLKHAQQRERKRGREKKERERERERGREKEREGDR